MQNVQALSLAYINTGGVCPENVAAATYGVQQATRQNASLVSLLELWLATPANMAVALAYMCAMGDHYIGCDPRGPVESTEAAVTVLGGANYCELLYTMVMCHAG